MFLIMNSGICIEFNHGIHNIITVYSLTNRSKIQALYVRDNVSKIIVLQIINTYQRTSTIATIVTKLFT